MSTAGTQLDERTDAYDPDELECRWAMAAHLSVFVLGIVGPVAIWLMMKDHSRFVSDQAKEALNFQLAMYLLAFVSIVTLFLSCLALVFLSAAWVLGFIAAMEAKQGGFFRYPYIFRMIE